MKYFLKILRDQKFDVKMINQSNKGFDLIILKDKPYNKIVNKLNFSYKRDIVIDIVWELKHKRGYFKIYKNIKMVSINDNFNTRRDRVEGKVINFTCEDVDYYAPPDGHYYDIGKFVPSTNKKYKDTTQLLRALKLSNINFDVNEK